MKCNLQATDPQPMRIPLIKAVTIDLWGTLLIDSPAADERYRRERIVRIAETLEDRGIQVPMAALARGYEESLRQLVRVWREMRDVPVERHATLLLQAVDAALPGRLDEVGLAEVAWAYASPALDAPPPVDPGAAAALETLAARGIAVCLVSNTMRTPGTVVRRFLEKAGLDHAFAGMVFSDECGFRKPNPAIFRCALRLLGVSARDAVHVGDDARLDVEGGHLSNMRVIQVGDGRQLDGGLPFPNIADAYIEGLSELPAAVEQLETLANPSFIAPTFSVQIAGHR
jgi:putative hydrolase of the HAD superfamily